MTHEKQAPLNILWTGGWDSTFRVLQAVLVEGRTVRPYYLINSGRTSTLQELFAIDRIKAGARQRATTGRILPVEYASKADVPHEEDLAAMHETMSRRMTVGTQYEWLARFARRYELDALELCVEKYPAGEESDFFQYLAANVEGTGRDCRLKAGHDEELSLFARFRFSTIHLTKLEMGALARRHGFYDLMEKTWYCHFPLMNQPCGRCRPCTMARKHRHVSFAAMPVVRGILRQVYRLGRRGWARGS